MLEKHPELAEGWRNMTRERYFYADPTAYSGIAGAESSRKVTRGGGRMTADELRGLHPNQRLSIIDRNKHWFSTPVRVGLIYEARKEQQALRRRR